MDYEKLGVFYLGRPYDPAANAANERAGYLLLKSKELTTHAVCVGMTGSGKTGLCVGLLEEAAMDGVPAIVIDPKGDMANLMLSFPDLSAEDFQPWIDTDAARKAGQSPDVFAAGEAAKWEKGLQAWGQDGQRIARMRQTTSFAVYTPGSTAGIPLSILQSFQAPPAAVRQDPELLQEQISGLTVSLLSLIGINADPIRSRESILVASLLQHYWQKGEDLDLARLIQLIQNPPLQQIGVMSLDTFYPEKDRMDLALRFNNLLASPGFSIWLQGDPLDIDQLLYTAEGKPRLSILSIAHLNEAERMFFVSLLLNKVVSWMRGQSGTSSLRALLYMDEIFGFFPPVANPPSKAPLLTLLKQARAYGLGVVLTTQNPVDLDYKGLANTGIWFIGRLQTERDKMRVLDGLEGATQLHGNTFNKAAMERLVSGLGNRVFLLHSVYQDEPVLFETRWCMSYLAGPLTRVQLQQLQQLQPEPVRQISEPVKAETKPHEAVEPQNIEVKPVSTASTGAGSGKPDTAPLLPQGVQAVYAPIRGRLEGLVYRPYLVGMVQIGYNDRKVGVYHSEDKVIYTPVTQGVFPVDWDQAQPLELALDYFEPEGSSGVPYVALPDIAGKPASYTLWKRDLADWAYRTCRLTLPQVPGTDLVAKPDEDERSFRLRAQQKTRERRDQETEKLRRSYATRIRALEEKIRKAEQAVERKKEQAKQQKMQTAISFGATLLSAFLGKKAVSASSLGKATTTVRGASRALKDSSEVGRSQESVEVYQAQLQELEEAFEAEAEALASRLDPLDQVLTEHVIQPYKKDIQVRDLIFAWMPGRELADGSWEQAWN